MHTEPPTQRRWRHPMLVAVATTVFVLAAASPARAAADPTAADDQYGAVLGEQSGGGGQLEGAGSLPFTGLDLILVLGAGTGLAAGGIALRRTARPRP